MAAAALPVMIGLSVAGTTSQFIGQRKAANAAQQQGNYEAAIQRQNAVLAGQQADDAIARGREAEMKSRGETKRLTGSQRASYGAQGIDLSSGSPADVMASDERLGELDALAIRQNARREAWGYRAQGAGYLAHGNLAQMAGRNTAASYRNASAGTLLSGAGELMSLYKKFGK